MMRQDYQTLQFASVLAFVLSIRASGDKTGAIELFQRARPLIAGQHPVADIDVALAYTADVLAGRMPSNQAEALLAEIISSSIERGRSQT